MKHLLCLAPLLLVFGASTFAAAQPNIIVFLVDDLGVIYGHGTQRAPAACPTSRSTTAPTRF